MQYRQISPAIQKTLQESLNQHPIIGLIVADIVKDGGSALLVGGAVRDLLLAKPIKDSDIEVHGIPLERLHIIMQKYGAVSLVGKSFGVLRVHSLEVDWSLPRVDTAGRKPTVVLDPYMSIAVACKRRDLTINAMAIDLTTFVLYDPYNGQRDLHDGILRPTDMQLFLEDPLRFFRVMQFIGRFAMVPSAELDQLCRTMDISGVSVERIEQEFSKLFLKSVRPAAGIRWIERIGRLNDVLPELAATRAIPQNPAWHPEGDVFEHTMQAVDAAAIIAQSYESNYDKLLLLYAALCHDLGKVTTTHVVDGVIKSELHAQEGAVISRQMLKRVTHTHDLIHTVYLLVQYHMEPGQFVRGGAKMPAYKRLARKLAPYTTLSMLADLALADVRGRNPQRSEPLTFESEDVRVFRACAQRARVLQQVEQPVLQGRDLLDLVTPGPGLGQLVRRAYEIQIEEGITDVDELKRRVLAE
jgi:tRNA nucleotidyltransferase (CCA-adding enzyme)